MAQKMRVDMRRIILPPRSGERRYPRHVKIKMRVILAITDTQMLNENGSYLNRIEVKPGIAVC